MSEDKQPIEVTLGNSDLFAWIDKEDEELLYYDWKLKQAGTKKFPHYYAICRWQLNGVRGEMYLHNEVWERMSGKHLPKGFPINMINEDKLDNRRSNLRLATRQDNEANKKKRRTQAGRSPSSQYKGVNKIKGRMKCWRAILTYESKQVNLGTFYTETEAAEAYNKAAIEYFGEFAKLNEIEKKNG